MMDIKQYIKAKGAAVDTFLNDNMPGENIKPDIIHQSMRYSVFAGGKRIRPVLCIAAFECVTDLSSEKVYHIASALELIHTYSLIHDDLPCMDNDDFRRGKPTNHKVYGDNIAVLAGDALLTYAFDLISKSEGIAAEDLLKIMRLFTSKTGSEGLIGGQVVDIISEGKEIVPETLEYIHKNKTSALIEVSVQSGAIAAGASGEKLKALCDYSEYAGLAFQVADDILDVVGDAEKMGKTLGKDEAVAKATYPALYGLDRSKEILNELVDKACKSLEIFGDKALPLVEIAKFIAYRDN